MSRIALTGLVVALASSACIIHGSDDGTTDPGPAPGPGGSIAPREGQWSYQERTPVSSTCPANVPGEAGGFLIDQSSASGFRVLPGDGTAPFRCTLDGATFSCPNRAAAVQDYRPAVDAIVTVHATATGSFSTAVRATGRQEATVDCAGTGCAGLASFPCRLTVNFAIGAL